MQPWTCARRHRILSSYKWGLFASFAVAVFVNPVEPVYGIQPKYGVSRRSPVSYGACNHQFRAPFAPMERRIGENVPVFNPGPDIHAVSFQYPLEKGRVYFEMRSREREGCSDDLTVYECAFATGGVVGKIEIIWNFCGEYHSISSVPHICGRGSATVAPLRMEPPLPDPVGMNVHYLDGEKFDWRYICPVLSHKRLLGEIHPHLRNAGRFYSGVSGLDPISDGHDQAKNAAYGCYKRNCSPRGSGGSPRRGCGGERRALNSARINA